MDDIKTGTVEAPEAMDTSALQPVGTSQLRKFTMILQKYKAGKTHTESRILASENWWKLRNTVEEQKISLIGTDGGFAASSGWLHNVIVSKHADAMDAYPEPNFLPREAQDQQEARRLSAIVPCVLEQNKFEATYSDAMWQKLKTGTAAYKVVWDPDKLGGLGDIAIVRVNLLNIYWEPGVTDIQASRYFFHTELYDRDQLEQLYPQLQGKLKGKTFASTRFLYDDTVDTQNKYTVIEVYYHKFVDGRRTLQYCKYVGDQVLYATENDAALAERGLYDHGKYPYELDPLFPIEGSPCGYGFVDICRNPQTAIDILNTSFVKNAMVGSVPRYFHRKDGNVNAEQFLDLTKPLVEVEGTLDEAALRRIEHSSLDGNYIQVLDRIIQELRETSGNTETSTGNVSSGVTAAAAIEALQEASGKGSRDCTRGSYRSFSNLIELTVENIRQFYNTPRQFRILGEHGETDFVPYSNEGIKPQHQGYENGRDMGYRLPVFDIKISAQKKNVYAKISQNELALQFFNLGFFNPQMADQAMMCLKMMDFEGKDMVLQEVSRNSTLHQKLVQYMQMALAFAQKVQPQAAESIAQDIAMTLGGRVPQNGNQEAVA
jgi:hypothetical protein